jgi:hypothetical protein
MEPQGNHGDQGTHGDQSDPYGAHYVEYEARPPETSAESAAATYAGRYCCPLIVNGKRQGHYIEPRRVRTASGWQALAAPATIYTRYHLLENVWGESGRAAAGAAASMRPLACLPEAGGALACLPEAGAPAAR